MRLFYLYIFSYLLFSNAALPQVTKPDSSHQYELNDVVVTAGKFESATKNISTHVEIIDQKKIENSGGTRLPEILKSSPNVYIKSYGLTPFLQTISMNGLGAEHTLILIDGVKLNSFQNAQLDLSLIPNNNIQRIEIMNNGGSSIYGSDAIGGVVNIITGSKHSPDNQRNFSIDVSASRGSFNTGRYSLALSKQHQNFETTVFYSTEKSDGSFEYNYDNGKEIIKKHRTNAGYNIYDTGINAQYFINSTSLIKFISTFSFQDKHVPGIETGSATAFTQQKDKSWNNILISENILSHSFSLHSSLNFQNNYMHYINSTIQNSFYKNLVYSASSELKWNNYSINAVAGYNFTHASLESNETTGNIFRNQHALFISTELPVLKGLRLFPSARYDFISDIKKSVVTYKAGLNFQPFEKIDFAIKGNTGKNFRSPTFNDLYWKEWGNPGIKPEYSYNAEAGVFYSLNYIIHATAEISYNYIKAKDKIVWMPKRNLIWTPLNIAESVSDNTSINISISKEFGEGVSAGISGSYVSTNSKKTSETYKGDPTYNKHIPYLPLESAKLSINAQYDFISVNLLYTHTGKRYADQENKNTVNHFNMVDGNVILKLHFYDLTTKLKLEINNITNQDYETISGYPMPLRYYNLTLSINY